MGNFFFDVFKLQWYNNQFWLYGGGGGLERANFFLSPPLSRNSAKEKLDSFERDIREGIKREITFEGDNIQKFSNRDDEFDTEPQIFEFPVNIEKFDYPLFERNPMKKPVIKSRKLEFLILSREYFSICKGATPFNLLEPKRAPMLKNVYLFLKKIGLGRRLAKMEVINLISSKIGQNWLEVIGIGVERGQFRLI